MIHFSEHFQTRLLDEHRDIPLGIENMRADWEQVYPQLADRMEAARRESVELHAPLASFFIYQQALNLVRMSVNLVDGLISLINADNPAAAPAVVRALFETCSVPCYMAQEVVPRLKKGRVNDVQRLLWRLGLGGNSAIGLPVRPIAVSALIAAAEREWPSAPEATPGVTTLAHLYGRLTDSTHPSFGSLTLGAMPQEDGLQHVLRPSCDVANSTGLLLYTVTMLALGKAAFGTVLYAADNYPMRLPNGEPKWQENDLAAGFESADPEAMPEWFATDEV